MSTPTVFLEGDAREAWLAERRTGIGSSDASAICGLNPWCSPLEVYMQKLDLLPEEPSNEAMFWGNQLEALVAARFEAETGFEVIVPSGMYRSEVWPFMVANVDRELAEPGAEIDALLECKTTGDHMADRWADGPPDYVTIQVQHQLAVRAFSRAWVAVLIGGRDYRQFEVERDDELIASLVQIEREFWEQHVVPQVPPPADGSVSSTEALRALYADFEKESTVDLAPEARALLDAYERTKAERKDLEAEERRQANAIKELLGPHHVGLLGGEKAVTWSRWTQKRLNREALEADHPHLVAEYLVDDRRDRLTITKAKS